MSTERTNVFKRENLDRYLNELSKEYKKLGGKNVPAEIVLIGGAAIVGNYGFRDMTADIDAVIRAASTMKDAINRVGDRFSLPNGWLNADFQNTKSYSDALLSVASFYKTFNQVLTVYAVTGEYLIAMKLRAFRQFKNDLSDIIGVLAEHKKRGDGITPERIENAVKTLYGSWDAFPEGAKEFIARTLAANDYEAVYDRVRQNEKEAKEDLLDFRDQYPGVLKADNAEKILQELRARKRRDPE